MQNRSSIMFILKHGEDMNKLTIAKRAQIIGMLVEGNSMRSTSRMADCSLTTVIKLLQDVGAACADYQDKALRNLPCKRIQCDEIWAFVGAKAKNASDEAKNAGTAGDVWTWTAIDADTKLMPCWMVGSRDANAAKTFIDDLAGRLKHRVQLTTDGHKPYLQAVENSFGGGIDYAQLIKIYGPTANGSGPAARYSPGECCGIEKRMVCGKPDVAKVSTSFVERSNLTMRMGMRRFTRLTNAFSKKVENHAHAIALHMMYYNFGRVHKTLRVTPAMEAGIASTVWTLEQIAALVVDEAPAKRGPYKKQA